MHPAIRKLAWESGMTLLAIALYGTALAGIGLAAVELVSRYVFVAPAAAERHADWLDGAKEPGLRSVQE